MGKTEMATSQGFAGTKVTLAGPHRGENVEGIAFTLSSLPRLKTTAGFPSGSLRISRRPITMPSHELSSLVGSCFQLRNSSRLPWAYPQSNPRWYVRDHVPHSAMAIAIRLKQAVFAFMAGICLVSGLWLAGLRCKSASQLYNRRQTLGAQSASVFRFFA